VLHHWDISFSSKRLAEIWAAEPQIAIAILRSNEQSLLDERHVWTAGHPLAGGAVAEATPRAHIQTTTTFKLRSGQLSAGGLAQMPTGIQTLCHRLAQIGSPRP
jgi:hypothetical protein